VNESRNEPAEMKLAPKAVVGRMSLYLRQLEAFQRQGRTTISSSQLGEPLSIKNAQVRKDLAYFGQFGHPGIGYRIDELIQTLRQILGIDKDWPLVLVGLGNLGRALLKYRGFRARGFQIVAILDCDPRKVGQVHEGLKVEPIESVCQVVKSHAISLALLCVPADAAQRVADQLIAGGIRGILNFAPVPLLVPPFANVVPVDLSVQLEHLAYKVKKTPEGLSSMGSTSRPLDGSLLPMAFSLDGRSGVGEASRRSS